MSKIRYNHYCVLGLFTLTFFNSTAQIGSPKSPQFSEYNPVTPGSPYYFVKTPSSTGFNTGHSSGMPDVNLLNNWDKLTPEQRNKLSVQIHGYSTPPTENDIQASLTQQLFNPQAKPKLTEYEQISLELIQDAYSSEAPRRKNLEYYKTAEFKVKEQSFKNAATSINQMLDGSKPLSIKDAYYQMESAFGNSYLSYVEYSNAIKESAGFIKKWMSQNGYDLKNNEHLHISIQKFMRDTLSIQEKNPDLNVPGQSKRHIPFRYDYLDFKSETDHRNFFITKALATGYGQCNSLPGLYLVLAEALGATTYLSFAPQHSFIKFPDNKGFIHNYEPTSNYKIDDKWYEDHMHIGKQAKVSGIYLDTLNKKMIIANCLNDLSFAYIRKLGIADGKFTLDCINDAMKHFPKGNNIYAYFLKGEILSHMLERIMYENKITNLENVSRLPEGQKLYQLLIENEQLIRYLGYQEIPEDMYLEMMEMHDSRAEEQQKNNVSGKQKKNLFIKNLN